MSKNDGWEFSFAEKNKSEEEQERTYAVYGETFVIEVTITINGDIDYINVTYIQNDSEVQQSRKPIRIRSCSSKRNNEKRVYSAVLRKRTKYENVLQYKFDYKDIDYDQNVVEIADIMDISDYSLVIVMAKSNISTSPVDIRTGKKEFKLGDDTWIITITSCEDQVKKFTNQLTYIMNIQGTKCLSSDSKIIQIANVGESLFQDNSSSATVEVTSISGVEEIYRFFRCKKCGGKSLPWQDNLQQCTVCRMKQRNDNRDTNISVTLYLTEPELSLTLFQDQLNNIVKIYNEENKEEYDENNRSATLTDESLTGIILSVSNVRIHYDKNTKIITDIQKM